MLRTADDPSDKHRVGSEINFLFDFKRDRRQRVVEFGASVYRSRNIIQGLKFVYDVTEKPPK